MNQAKELVPADKPAKGLILTGLFIETVMPLAILTGVMDRLAAFIMAGYCGATAVLFKRFWEPGDFWDAGKSQGRELFWEFLKNFSLAGGFLLITFGTRAGSEGGFLANPLSSSRPYRTKKGARKHR